ncbi:MAG TPA: hypothetical protein PKJ28_02670 [Bacteroidales bacterium]|nr:hypothetical protein [Bacteroidales bacterium]HPS73132.1 hypothetical protein [Bacteroidales bacterium]
MDPIRKMKRGNCNILLFIMVFELFFLVIVYKIFHVPVTHDEAFTAIHYTPYSYWEIMMYPDAWPNNHILNTLLVKFFSSLFGMEQWAIRIPNMLAFLLYAIGVFRLVRAIFRHDSPFLLPASILFICNPYLLDFFGLARGYGLCIGLATLSLSYLITGIKRSRTPDIWMAFFLSMLASYANFASIILFLTITIIITIYFFYSLPGRGKKPLPSLLILFTFCIAYGLLILTPFLKMQKEKMFDFFGSHGFYYETMLSLTHNILTENPKRTPFDHPLAIFLMGVVVLNIVIVLVRFFKSKRNTSCFRQPIWISSIVLTLSVLLNFLEHLLLKTPYLTGRIGLFYFPLFICPLVCLISLTDSGKGRVVKVFLSAVVSLALIIHLGLTVRLSYAREWWFDAHTLTVINYLNNAEKGHTIKLKTDWHFNPSFTFYKETGKTANIDLLNYDNKIDVNTDADYYYIFTDDFEQLKSRFDPVWETWGRFMLVKAKRLEIKD